MTARIIVPLLALLAGCAGTPGVTITPDPCPHIGRRTIRDVLYFGRSIPGGGIVTDSAWARFVAEVITPAFPEGFTVTSGTGQWRGADGNVISEQTSIVTILHPETQEAEAAVIGIGERYRVHFRQEAVLHEHHWLCTSLIDGTP